MQRPAQTLTTAGLALSLSLLAALAWHPNPPLILRHALILVASLTGLSGVSFFLFLLQARLAAVAPTPELPPQVPQDFSPDLTPAETPLEDVPSFAPLTPLGRLHVDGEVGPGHFTPDNPDEVKKFGDTAARLLTWKRSFGRVELLFAPFTPDLPDVERLDGCLALIWRVRAEKALGRVTFHCRLSDLPQEALALPDGSEGVEAVTFHLGDAQATIATEDEGALDDRAWRGQGLPKRLAPRIDPTVVQYLSDGLRVSLPPLVRGERCQIHFVIAWTHAAVPGHCPTRQAADFLADMDFGPDQ